MTAQLFHTFNVERQIFFRSPKSFGLVNLKPLLPGHVLICPQRVVPRLADLSSDEVSDLFLSVQKVTGVLQTVYKATGTTISLQDGPVAGQSVPHVHVHILPRKANDLPNSDDIYGQLDQQSEEMLQSWQAALAQRPKFTVVDDESRKPRTIDEMEEEAKQLATFFE
ncbi:HIT-like domain-containing protein, partial [Protomyces lactucae-debilis]